MAARIAASLLASDRGLLATTDYSLDRGLPASVEAERSVLGAILLDRSEERRVGKECRL